VCHVVAEIPLIRPGGWRESRPATAALAGSSVPITGQDAVARRQSATTAPRLLLLLLLMMMMMMLAGWRFSAVVASFVVRTKLLNVEHG